MWNNQRTARLYKRGRQLKRGWELTKRSGKYDIGGLAHLAVPQNFGSANYCMHIFYRIKITKHI
jgi:hypothetical protein